MYVMTDAAVVVVLEPQLMAHLTHKLVLMVTEKLLAVAPVYR